MAVALVAVAATGTWMLTRDSSDAATTPMTSTISAQTVQQTVSVTGTMAAASTADLDFAVSGTVTRVLVAEGDHVTKGQVLARVDDIALRASRTAAVSALDAAQEQLDEDEDDDASAVQVAADEAAVTEAENSLTEARTAVDDAALRSTIAGTVTSLGLEIGDVVGTGSSSSTGSASSVGAAGAGATAATTTAATTTAAVTVTSTDRFVLDATVASSEVARVKEGLQAQLTITGVDDVVYGTVQDIGLVAQTSSSGAAVFPVTIAVTGTRDDLYGGTSATASIIVKQVDDVLTVPSRALQTDGDTTYVDKVVDGSTVRTTVVTGTAYGQSTEVTSGLVAGDVVQLPGFTPPTGGGTGEQTGGFPGGGEGFPGGGQGFPAGGPVAP